MNATKICFIYNNRFGEYPILHEYCTTVSNKGYEVYYIGVSSTPDEFISQEGISVTHIIHQSPISSAQAICTKIKKINPDLIHVFHFRWCFLIPFLYGSRKSFLLEVRTVHVANKKGKHSSLSFLKNRLTWLENFFYSNTIALSTDIRKMLRPSRRNIPIIPLGANTKKLQPSDKIQRRERSRNNMGIPFSDKVYIYSGTLSSIRKIDNIIISFTNAELHKKAWLIIAGDDKDDPNSLIKLKEQAKDLNASSRIIFTGFIHFNELVDLYLASDIGVCYIPQTKFFDLQPPTKLFEYLAAGLIVIATNTTADRAIIEDNVNGYLCEDNVEDLAKTMLQTVNEDEKKIISIKTNGFATVEKYSWNNIIEHYLLPFYDKIIIKKHQ